MASQPQTKVSTGLHGGLDSVVRTVLKFVLWFFVRILLVTLWVRLQETKVLAELAAFLFPLPYTMTTPVLLDQYRLPRLVAEAL